MSKVPKLRFKEFRGDWRIDALEPHVDILSGVPLKSDEISEDEKGVPILRGINITEGFIRHSKDIDRYYLSSTKQVEKFLVAKGDLVIGMDGSKVGKNVALVSESDSGAILIQRVARIRSRHTSDIRFIYHHIFSPKFHRYVDEVNTSSGIPHISLKQINEFKIGFPSLPEQQKIASFLSAVDEKIQQLTRKKEWLEQYKKGVMQQLFSGKLRFKDENGKPYPKWEEKPFGSICTFINGKAYKQEELLKEGKYRVLRVGNLFSNNEWYYSDLELEGDKYLEKGDLMYAWSATFGPRFWEEEKIIYHYHIWKVIPGTEVDKFYLFHAFMFDVERIKAVSQGGTMFHITKGNIETRKFKFPCKEEQKKIASFLTALDAKIESVAAQIAHTQTFKKGLLQQMFV